MDETHIPAPEQDRTVADFLLHVINERESDLQMLSKPDSWKAMAFEEAGTRQQAVDIVAQEIAALQALDPATATEEQIRAVSRTYQDHLDGLRLKA